jgi:hypothetical protein
MTAEEARRWNAGEWTAEDDEGPARVCLPDEYEQPSYLRGGEVVMGTPRLTQSAKAITFAGAARRGLYEEYMEGNPARLIEADVDDREDALNGVAE